MSNDGPTATQELAALEADVARFADVHREHLAAAILTVRFDPKNAGALPFSWMLLGDGEIILEAGAGAGGRWELASTPGDVHFLRDLVGGIVAGRVEETFGPNRRSSVCVTLAHGRTVTSTGSIGLWPPAWGWKRRGRRVRYAPYAQN